MRRGMLGVRREKRCGPSARVRPARSAFAAGTRKEVAL